MKTIKVVHIIDTLNVGGAERLVLNLVNQSITIDNVEMSLCLTRNKGSLYELLDERVNAVCVNKSSTFDIIGLIRCIKFVRRTNGCLIHCHSNSVYWGFLIRFLTGNKLIWHIHSGNISSMKRMNLLLLKVFATSISGIITVNHDTLRWARKIFRNSKLINLQNFAVLSMYKTFANSDFKGASGNSITFISVGNLRDEKGYIEYLDIVSKLRNRIKEKNNLFSVKIIGKVQNLDYHNTLIEKISLLHLEDCVSLVTDCMDPTPHLLNADIAVIPSKTEGLPLSLIEYGLFNLPVVAAKIGGIPDYLHNGKYGVLVSFDCVDQVVDSMEELLIDINYRKSLGEKFGDYVKRHSDPISYVNEYVKFLENVS